MSYATHFEHAETTDNVIILVLSISINTCYFQNSFLASVIFWTQSTAMSLVGSLYRPIMENNNSISEVVSRIHLYAGFVMVLYNV